MRAEEESRPVSTGEEVLDELAELEGGPRGGMARGGRAFAQAIAVDCCLTRV